MTCHIDYLYNTWKVTIIIILNPNKVCEIDIWVVKITYKDIIKSNWKIYYLPFFENDVKQHFIFMYFYCYLLFLIYVGFLIIELLLSLYNYPQYLSLLNKMHDVLTSTLKIYQEINATFYYVVGWNVFSMWNFLQFSIKLTCSKIIGIFILRFYRNALEKDNIITREIISTRDNIINKMF